METQRFKVGTIVGVKGLDNQMIQGVVTEIVRNQFNPTYIEKIMIRWGNSSTPKPLIRQNFGKVRTVPPWELKDE